MKPYLDGLSDWLLRRVLINLDVQNQPPSCSMHDKYNTITESPGLEKIQVPNWVRWWAWIVFQRRKGNRKNNTYIHTYIHTYILVKSYILYHSTSSVCWLWNCMDHNILDSWNQQAGKHRRKRNGDLAAHKFTAQVKKKNREKQTAERTVFPCLTVSTRQLNSNLE